MTLLPHHPICERMRAAALAGVLFAIGMVVVAIPATSHAAGTQRCVSMGAFDGAGLHGFLERDATPQPTPNAAGFESTTPETTTVEPATENISVGFAESTPCEVGLSDIGDEDPSFNLCFEAVEEHVSTLPRFIAQWRGEKEAASVVDSIFRALERGERDFERPPAAATSAGSVLVAISLKAAPERNAPADDSLMCTATHPEQCHALPPVTGSMEIAGAAGVTFPRHLFEVLSPEPPADMRPWADLRVGPQAGHSRVPKPPPRA